MRYTDLFESKFLTDEDDIMEFMEKSFRDFNPNNLNIEPDGLVYNGDLKLIVPIEKLKVNFKSVTGNFNCSYSGMTSLIGSPKTVGGYFFCSGNTRIINLEGCPESIGEAFNCSGTKITSLKYCPQLIGNNFYCYNIKITDPKEYRFVLYSEIGGEINSHNQTIDDIINTYKGSKNKKHWAYAINLLSKVQL